MECKLSKEQIETYLGQIEVSPNTRTSYRRALERLYLFLDEGKSINTGTLTAWQGHLLETGYSSQTVNSYTSAANGLVSFLGHREMQADRLPEEKAVQPELTRAEYLRLLSAARALGKERAYLLVKLFGTVGLSVGDVDKVTAEAVRAGKLRCASGSVRIPDGLREELQRFVQEEGISSGPVFRTRDGKPQDRTTISTMVKSLSRDARVSKEKANPRSLKRMYRAAQAGIRDNLSVLADQAYDRLLEKEQDVIGRDGCQP